VGTASGRRSRSDKDNEISADIYRDSETDGPNRRRSFAGSR